jgi:hypothetical protein
VGLLALTLVRLIRPLHVPSLIALAPQTCVVRGRTVKATQHRTHRCNHGWCTQRVAKYTSPVFARQSTATEPLLNCCPRLSRCSRCKRTQAPVDTVYNCRGATCALRRTSIVLWKRSWTRPLSAHGRGAWSGTRPCFCLRRGRSACPARPARLVRPVAPASRGRRSPTRRPLVHPREGPSHRSRPTRPLDRPLWTLPHGSGETNFPHFQQKRWCMRASHFGVLHVFHTCG